MRSAFPFDTHAYVKKLVAAGVSERQAEVQAEALADIALANLATKDDLRTMEERLIAKTEAVEERLMAKIEALRVELKSEFKAELSERMRQQMVWFLMAQIALFGAAIALIKLL